MRRVQAFEPREFIEAGEHVTVLGWESSSAVDTGKKYERKWVHVFNVKSGKITLRSSTSGVRTPPIQ